LIFALRHLESMTVEEVARSMELSPSTVKRSLDHASKKLLRWMESNPDMVELLQGGSWVR
jgi:DNA-directed RNA polymerase specialized sigma24 family protein